MIPCVISIFLDFEFLEIDHQNNSQMCFSELGAIDILGQIVI